jgi:voltage-gated potassium channel
MKLERRVELLDRVERATELPMVLLALAVIPLVLIPELVTLGEATLAAVDITFYVLAGIFAVDIGVRLYLAPRRLEYAVKNWYDIVVLGVVLVPAMGILRSARALRLLRLLRALPFLMAAAGHSRRLAARGGFHYVGVTGLAAVLICAGAVLIAERSTDGPIDDYGTALWWAVTTITTVGYGDAFPVSAEGRGIAVALMLLGIAFFSWITANVAAFLVEGRDANEKPVTLGDVMAKLEALEEQVKRLGGEGRDAE